MWLSHEQLLTDPEEAAKFVDETQVDSLAIAIGTSHGAYKFQGVEGIQFKILEDIQKRLPDFPIVLHGGSAVNLHEIERINLSGGNLDNGAAGVPSEEIVQAIKYGVCKINIATDLRLLWARVHREFFKNSPKLLPKSVVSPITIREGEILSLNASPSLRNSGLETTSNNFLFFLLEINFSILSSKVSPKKYEVNKISVR